MLYRTAAELDLLDKGKGDWPIIAIEGPIQLLPDFWDAKEAENSPSFILWCKDLPFEDPLRVHLGLDLHVFDPEGPLLRLWISIYANNHAVPLAESEQIIDPDTKGAWLGLKFLEDGPKCALHIFRVGTGKNFCEFLVPDGTPFGSLSRSIGVYQGGILVVCAPETPILVEQAINCLRTLPGADFGAARTRLLTEKGYERWKQPNFLKKSKLTEQSPLVLPEFNPLFSEREKILLSARNGSQE